MGEVELVVSDAGDGLRARLDEEINSFNARVTGWTDARLLTSARFQRRIARALEAAIIRFLGKQ